MYHVESKRRELKKTLGTLDDWLKTLKTEVVVEECNEANHQRTSQLLNKTNQMNLSTRRMTETELAEWNKEEII